MALTWERLMGLLGEPLCPCPSGDGKVLRVRGLNGAYSFVPVLDRGGEFLQFRTLQYHSCRRDHPNLAAVLQVLAGLNLELRFVKFAWDSSDGEIVAYGDVWVCDGELTDGQFGAMIKSFMTSLDRQYPRIDTTIATGEDPGEVDPLEGVSGTPGESLPHELRARIDRLLREHGESRED
jgi:hypothetical protein